MRDDTPSLFDLSGSGQTHGRFEPARLTQARVRKSVTKTELAAKVGVSWQTISEWERGNMQPRMKHVRALCEALDVTPEELLGTEWFNPKSEAA